MIEINGKIRCILRFLLTITIYMNNNRKTYPQNINQHHSPYTKKQLNVSIVTFYRLKLLTFFIMTPTFTSNKSSQRHHKCASISQVSHLSNPKKNDNNYQQKG